MDSYSKNRPKLDTGSVSKSAHHSTHLCSFGDNLKNFPKKFFFIFYWVLGPILKKSPFLHIFFDPNYI